MARHGAVALGPGFTSVRNSSQAQEFGLHSGCVAISCSQLQELLVESPQDFLLLLLKDRQVRPHHL